MKSSFIELQKTNAIYFAKNFKLTYIAAKIKKYIFK